MLPELLPFQSRVRDLGVKLRRMPIKSPMGSGKTLMALSIWDQLGLADQREPVVILARVNAQLTWIKHIQDHFPEHAIIAQARGTPKQREYIWRNRHLSRFIICTYEGFRQDVKLGFVPKGLNYILDEPHRYLRDHRKVTFKAVFEKTWDSEVIIPVSGTFIRRGPLDLYSMLLLCNRKDNKFTSFWRYVNTWHIVIDGPFGKEIAGPRNVNNYKEEILAKYTGWVTNEEASKYMPKGSRIRVPVEISKEQESLIDQIMNRTHITTDAGLILLPNAMTRILRYRQALVCPRIFGGSYGYGAALEEIGDRLEETDQERPVIFTPFTESIPYIEEYLHGRGFAYTYAFQGGLDVEDLGNRVRAFQADPKGVGIVSVSYAESFEFPRSSEGFFLGYSWSWIDNEQAEGRMTRLISENRNPRFFYCIHYGHLDERMFEVLNRDAANAAKVTPENLMEMYVKLRTS